MTDDHAPKVLAEEYLTEFIQMPDAIRQESKKRVGVGETDILLIHPEPGIRQDFENGVLPLRVAEKQLLPFLQRDFLPDGGKRIQFCFPIAENHLRDHAGAIPVEINPGVQRKANQHPAELLAHFHGSAKLQIGKNFTDDPLSGFQRIIQDDLVFFPAGEQEIEEIPLFLRNNKHMLSGEKEAALDGWN